MVCPANNIEVDIDFWISEYPDLLTQELNINWGDAKVNILLEQQ